MSFMNLPVDVKTRAARR